MWRHFDIGFHHERNFKFKESFLKQWIFVEPFLPTNSVDDYGDPDQAEVIDGTSNMPQHELNLRFLRSCPIDLSRSIGELVKLGRNRISAVSVDFRGWGLVDNVESIVNSLPWLTEPADSLKKIEILCDPSTSSVINAIDFLEQLFAVTCFDRTTANPCLTLQG